MKFWFERDAVKYVAIAIAIVGVLLYVVVNHSVAEEKNVVCDGSFYSEGKPPPKQDIYFKYQKYRWWVRLWGDGDGAAYVQREGGQIDYTYYVEFWDGWGDVVFDKVGGGEKGRYSGMSKTINYVRGESVFEGKCRAQN